MAARQCRAGHGEGPAGHWQHWWHAHACASCSREQQHTAPSLAPATGRAISTPSYCQTAPSTRSVRGRHTPGGLVSRLGSVLHPSLRVCGLCGVCARGWAAVGGFRLGTDQPAGCATPAPRPQDWQAIAAAFAWRESGQPGKITRIANCNEKDTKAYNKEMLKVGGPRGGGGVMGR